MSLFSCTLKNFATFTFGGAALSLLSGKNPLPGGILGAVSFVTNGVAQQIFGKYFSLDNTHNRFLYCSVIFVNSCLVTKHLFNFMKKNETDDFEYNQIPPVFLVLSVFINTYFMWKIENKL